MSKSELAEKYGVTIDTMRKWVQKVRDRHELTSSKYDKILPPSDVAKIVSVLGYWE